MLSRFAIFLLLLVANRAWSFDSIQVYESTLDFCGKISLMRPEIQSQWVARGLSPSQSFQRDVLLTIRKNSAKETFSEFTVRVPSAAFVLMSVDPGMQKALSSPVCEAQRANVEALLHHADRSGKALAGVTLLGAGVASNLVLRGIAWASPWVARIAGVSVTGAMVYEIYETLRANRRKTAEFGKQCGQRDDTACAIESIQHIADSIGESNSTTDVATAIRVLLEQEKHDLLIRVAQLSPESSEYLKSAKRLSEIQTALDFTQE